MDADQLFDDSEATAELITAATPWLVEFMLAGGRSGYADLGVRGAFDVTNPEVQTWLREYVFKFAEKVSATTSDQLREALTEALNTGETIPQIAARVQDIFGDQATAYRAEMIARTESSRAQNHGSIEAYKQSGLVDGLEWTAFDGCCEFCDAMDGMIVAIGTTFFDEGDTLTLSDEEGTATDSMTFTYEDIDCPPAHPDCRCTLSPVLTEAE